MKKINKKLMAFIGTEEVCRLIDDLSEYTEGIYAAVAPEYGAAPDPGGNITIIRRYLDEEGIRKWVQNAGIETLIDGTSVMALEEREKIRRTAEALGLEYARISPPIRPKPGTEFCTDYTDLLRMIEYSVGHVLVEGRMETFEALTRAPGFREKLVVLSDTDPDQIRKLEQLGYPGKHIVCTGHIRSASFLEMLFSEFHITHYIFPGDVKAGLEERIEATRRTMLRVTVFGELAESDGQTAEEYLRSFEKQNGIYRG